MSQAEDMAAINTYFQKEQANTPVAATMKNQFGSWYSGLGWFDINMNGAIYDEARRRRKDFNAANGIPENPKGLTTEQMGQASVLNQVIGTVSTTLASSASKATTSINGATPTIRRGSQGAPVVRWQTIIGVAADGNFGSGTEAATKVWQKNKGLTADGVVGPMTWAKALGDPEPQKAPLEAVAAIGAGVFKSSSSSSSSTPAPTPKAVTPTSSTGLSGISSLNALPFWAKAVAAVGSVLAFAGIVLGIKTTLEDK